MPISKRVPWEGPGSWTSTVWGAFLFAHCQAVETTFYWPTGPWGTVLCSSIPARDANTRNAYLEALRPPCPRLQPGALLSSTLVTGRSLPLGGSSEDAAYEPVPWLAPNDLGWHHLEMHFSFHFPHVTEGIKTVCCMWRGRKHNLCPPPSISLSIQHPASQRCLLGPKVRQHLAFRHQR